IVKYSANIRKLIGWTDWRGCFLANIFIRLCVIENFMLSLPAKLPNKKFIYETDYTAGLCRNV
ncbi:MAG: hypothetical protein LBR06_06580, partial [Bacteroidales bacterium]|nr:hypothetical protein [Bacteroidales bacterium]